MLQTAKVSKYSWYCLCIIKNIYGSQKEDVLQIFLIYFHLFKHSKFTDLVRRSMAKSSKKDTLFFLSRSQTGTMFHYQHTTKSAWGHQILLFCRIICIFFIGKSLLYLVLFSSACYSSSSTQIEQDIFNLLLLRINILHTSLFELFPNKD